MNPNQQFLQNLYDAFNKREIETIISLMRPDVKWANGLEGGFVHGRDAVREYWTTQFKNIQPELETLKFETDEQTRNVVTVHQIIKDLQGNVLADTHSPANIYHRRRLNQSLRNRRNRYDKRDDSKEQSRQAINDIVI